MPELRAALDIFNGLGTARKEASQMQLNMPMLEAHERKVGPQKDDIAYTVMLTDWLEQKMAHDSKYTREASMTFLPCLTNTELLVSFASLHP